MKTIFIPLLVGGLTSTAMAAGVAAPEADRLLACYQLQDTVVRLQCFDRLVAPLAQQARASAPAAAPSPAPAPAPAASLPEFGQEQLKPDAQSTPSPESVALHARIASLRKGAQGTHLVTLDNGQVWRHENSAQGEYLIVGEAVTISRAALGSYRLTRDAGKAKNWIRVNRIR